MYLKIVINFTPTGGSIENLSANYVKMDSEFKSLKFEGSNNCLNITNICKITWVFTPTKAVSSKNGCGKYYLL